MDSKSMQPGATPGLSAMICFLVRVRPETRIFGVAAYLPEVREAQTPGKRRHRKDRFWMGNSSGESVPKEETLEEKVSKPVKKRMYRKRVRIFNVINKIKLWPSRNGNLHGVRSIEVTGNVAKITTHCNKELYQKNSLNSRAGRWLRNKWYVKPCAACRVPDWKIEKYSSTRFRRHQGSMLIDSAPVVKFETIVS